MGNRDFVSKFAKKIENNTLWFRRSNTVQNNSFFQKDFENYLTFREQ